MPEGNDCTHLNPDEILMRSVKRGDIEIASDGKITRLSREAFADRTMKVSVDREKLRTPDQTRMSTSDVVVSLSAAEAVSCGPIEYSGSDDKPASTHVVIACENSIPGNDAHALVCGKPQFTARSAFDKLKKHLAYQSMQRNPR